ncbi:hypothetical protein MBLNU230_g2537t1 [Neophaeotheca triangularis]
MLKRQAEDRPQCGSDEQADDYNTGLQIFGIFLLLTVGTLASSFPSIMRRFPHLRIPTLALFISRHFGTGVILATAFCHLLTTAYKKLGDPCLPPFFNQGYPAIPGFIAMMAVLVLVAIEMTFVTHGLKHCHAIEIGQRECDGCLDVEQGAAEAASSAQPNLSNGEAMQWAKSQSESSSLSDRQRNLQPAADDESCPPAAVAAKRTSSHTNQDSAKATADTETIASQANEQRRILQCLLLEVGILFHSIFIGISIAFSTGNTWVVLIIAICFHQIFEGLALGSRIASIPSFRPKSFRPWLMSLGYGITAPTGIAIGLGVHGSYHQDGEMGLLLVGFFNAISAGLLLYAGMVQLLAEDLTCEQSYRRLAGWRRLVACLAVLLGALLMALIAVWV